MQNIEIYILKLAFTTHLEPRVMPRSVVESILGQMKSSSCKVSVHDVLDVTFNGMLLRRILQPRLVHGVS